MTFREMRNLMWRDRRIGLCQWRELIVRNLRSRYIDGGCPRDFESEFRRLAGKTGRTPVLQSGRVGAENLFSSWETVISGVPTPGKTVSTT